VKVNLIRTFKYAENGNQVITLEKGEHDLPERWAKKAIQGGFAEKKTTKAKKPPLNKSK